MECAQVQRQLWSGEASGSEVELHLRGCDVCSVEAARATHLASVLGSLEPRLQTPPPDLESALLAMIPRSRAQRAREVVSHPRFWRGAAAVGAAAATVAAVLVARRVARPDLVA